MSQGHVEFEANVPERRDRAQLVLRLALVAVLGLLQADLPWIILMFYLGLPIVAAVSIQRHGAEVYPRAGGAMVFGVLRWWTAFLAYMLFLSDRFPAVADDLTSIRFEVNPSGSVDFNRALLRWLASLPELIVLAGLTCGAVPLGVVAAASVLLTQRVPDWVQRYLRFYVSLQARWLVYHASLVDSHPLFDAPRWQPH
jgi:hypothetical protein